MKKIAAILLCGIFLFNWFGYRLVTYYLEQRADEHLVAQLDQNNYEQAELISIKLPVNLPYYTHSKQYERTDGEIEINGVHYNYVKRRLYNDSLEYLCIANTAKTRLYKATNDFFKLVNDIQRPSQTKKTGSNTAVYKSFLSEFFEEAHHWSIRKPENELKTTTSFYSFFIPFQIISPQERPPDVGEYFSI